MKLLSVDWNAMSDLYNLVTNTKCDEKLQKMCRLPRLYSRFCCNFWQSPGST